jgi:acetyltransferase-like isoleucine patch superfamily enzyme
MVREILNKINFWKNTDRIGPDIPYTHWRLYFKSTMLKLCKQKFNKFDETSEFRPGAYAVCCSKISIGKRVVIRPNTVLSVDPRNNGQGLIIEDDVLIGPGVNIYVDTHAFDNPEIPIIDQGYFESKKVIIKKGCWIGANVIILPGVTIGENAVVGAGSIVTKSIPDRVVAVGNPARIIRSIN